MDGGGRFSEPLSPSGYDRAAGPFARLSDALLRRLRRRALSVRRARPGVDLAKRLPRGAGSVGLAVGAAALALAGFVASGRYDALVAAQGRPLDIAARLAGFGVERVTISGLSRMYEREVLAAAGIDWRTSVPFLDVAEVRAKLLRVPLIAQASVRKIYPHEIAITQVEREPAALWQRDGVLKVISADGKEIDTMRDDRYLELPLIVGSVSAEGVGAGATDEDEKDRLRARMLREYLALREVAGPLRGRISAGTYVSGRRWTLKIDGIDVRLPEQAPEAAVKRLVRLEGEAGILEKDVIAIDLRMDDRVVVRLTEEAAAARAEAQKAKKKGAAT